MCFWKQFWLKWRMTKTTNMNGFISLRAAERTARRLRHFELQVRGNAHTLSRFTTNRKAGCLILTAADAIAERTFP